MLLRARIAASVLTERTRRDGYLRYSHYITLSLAGASAQWSAIFQVTSGPSNMCTPYIYLRLQTVT